MTYEITRHARISIPNALKPAFTVKNSLQIEESKGVKRFFQKTLGLLPVPALGVLAGASVFNPALASIGLSAGTAGYTALILGSGATLVVAAFTVLDDISSGRRKYLPGKDKECFTNEQTTQIEPYAEWDKVFLPYAVESFNGVKVKDAEGKLRDPVHLYTTPYIEFRTKPREEYIDYSVMEAQKVS